MRVGSILTLTLLFVTSSVLAAPDTVASVRARAHQEIADRDATIAALQQKIAMQQKQLDLQQEKFALALQLAKKLRASLVAAGVVLPDNLDPNSLDLEPVAPESPADGTQIAAAKPLPYAPPITPQTYRYVPPPGNVPASLMRYERLIDRYVKLHPDVIVSAAMKHGRIEWVRVVDATRSDSVAYPYTVSAEVGVIYPADPEDGENDIYRSIERPTFQVNPATGEVGGEGQF